MRTEDILCKVRAATGRCDPGDPAALDALERLVEASNEEANLSAVGAQRWEANLVGILSNRLRITSRVRSSACAAWSGSDLLSGRHAQHIPIWEYAWPPAYLILMEAR